MKIIATLFASLIISGCSTFFVVGLTAVEAIMKTGSKPCEIEHIGDFDRYLKESVEERNRNSKNPQDWQQGVPSKPSQTYTYFSTLNYRFPQLGPGPCLVLKEKKYSINTSSGTTETNFDQEWEFQQKFEAERLANLEKLENHNKKMEEEREAQKKSTVAYARKLGIKDIIFDFGLVNTIDEVIAGNIDIESLRKIAIELDDFRDASLVAFQIPAQGQALYQSDMTQTIIWLKNYPKPLLQHSSLLAIDNIYVTIEGLQHYKTLFGTNQAIVIKPAW